MRPNPFTSRSTRASLVIVLLSIVAGDAFGQTAARTIPPRVDLEVVTVERPAPLDAQQWGRALQQVGADAVRIRGPRSGDQVELTESGSAGAKRYRLVGMLNDRGQLELPGGERFTLRETNGIRDYIERLKTQVVDGVTGKRGPFGLTEKQMTTVYTALATPITETTAGQTPNELVKKITAKLKQPVVTAEAAEWVLEKSKPSPLEVQSLATGTGLSAILRSYGLGFAPRIKEDGTLELAIQRIAGEAELWPVGVPLDGRLAEKIPVLIERREVEIADIPLSDVLAAVGPRLPLPMLMDHSLISEQNIDPATATVSHALRQASYNQVLQRVLSMARLKHEIRQDEAGKPFIWITTIRQPARSR